MKLTSLYKMLKSAKLGAGAAQDFHTAIMAQKMPFAKRSGAEHEYTGAVPVTFTANGQPLLDYLINGNNVQSGTPASDNPIMPEGTGDLETSGEKAGQYKILIASANTTTPVYLGEVETTRRIKKLVFDGTEGWTWRRGEPSNVFFIEIQGLHVVNDCGLCTHYPNQNSGSFATLEDKHLLVRLAADGTKSFFAIRDTNYELPGLNSYIAAQYAAGTPVTVWCVLATEETAVVNEPLMRIGNYADTLSHAQAGVSIPTANGSTTLDVETAVKPSEIYIKYKS